MLLLKKLFLLLLLPTYLFCATFDLSFQGNSAIRSSELYKALNLENPYFYEFYKQSPQVQDDTLNLLEQTLLDYYKSHGFFHASIEIEHQGDRVTFIIQENEPLEIVKISYDSPLELPSLILFQEFERFDAIKFRQTKKDIRTLYQNAGYCHVALDAKAYVDSQKNEAELSYKVVPNELCYFGALLIEPNPLVDIKIIETLVEIEEGAPYSLDVIVKSYENIYIYPGISKVRIEPRVKDGNNSVDVAISYEANEKPLRFELGLGASSDEGLMAQLGLKNRNFLGNLKTLGIQTRLTQIKQEVSLFLDVPLAYKNFTGASVGYVDEKFELFRESHVNTRFFVKHRYYRHTFEESILLDRSKTYDVDATIQDFEEQLFVSSLKLEWIYDTRDSLLDPRKGYFFGAEVWGSQKSTISDATYYKTRVLAGAIGSIDEHVFALKGLYGLLHLVDGVIPSSYRFFSGGMYSNRAYRYRELGPSDEENNPLGSDSIFQVNAEYRYKIYGNFRGVLFSDTTYLGNDTSPDMSNGYYTLGLGIRYKSPIGPIALDFGCDVTNPSKFYAFHFHIGELF